MNFFVSGVLCSTEALLGKSRIGEVRRKATGREGITITNKEPVLAICENKKKGVAPLWVLRPFLLMKCSLIKLFQKPQTPFSVRFGRARHKNVQTPIAGPESAAHKSVKGRQICPL